MCQPPSNPPPSSLSLKNQAPQDHRTALTTGKSFKRPTPGSPQSRQISRQCNKRGPSLHPPAPELLRNLCQNPVCEFPLRLQHHHPRACQTPNCRWCRFLSDKRQHVKLGKHVSDSLTGSPQGSVPSPLLLTLYANSCTSLIGITILASHNEMNMIYGDITI